MFNIIGIMLGITLLIDINIVFQYWYIMPKIVS